MNLRALIVEDDAMLLEVLSTFVEQRGFTVTRADRGDEAQDLWARDRHELVITDVGLPGLDGLALCRGLRALPDGREPLILVVTARTAKGDLQLVLDAGADDYLPKPLDLERLAVRLEIDARQLRDRLERKRAEEKLAESRRRIEAQNADLEAILHSLRDGAVLLDADRRVTFMNAAARAVLTPGRALKLPAPWQDVAPLGAADHARFEAIAQQPHAARRTLPLFIDAPGNRRYAVELQIEDDPRAASGRILFLYDVSEVHDLRAALGEHAAFHTLIGQSRAMTQVYRVIQQVAGVDATVLIEGETGTGKELVARAIHYTSHRRARPFLAVNCAGLTDSLLASQLFGHRRGAFTGAFEDHKGVFEAAEGGTLLLDEIGDISLDVQKSLLRVLQEKEITRVGDSKPRPVDVRVLVATHRELTQEVAAGRFRSDLMYRIRVARVALPPLRQRLEDIPTLVVEFLRQCHASMGKPVREISQGAMTKLLGYPWPGNVRELRSAIEFAVIRSEGLVLLAADLPPELVGPNEDPSGGGAAHAPTDEVAHLEAALTAAKGNRAMAAKLMGVSRATFYRRLAALGKQEKA